MHAVVSPELVFLEGHGAMKIPIKPSSQNNFISHLLSMIIIRAIVEQKMLNK